ncbi:MAG: hypothetical protein N3F04_06215 [Candidatus Nezhaarchaeota archaeon]|nr:hypothetical protein [Candidatus Nezhaarchaeota archaeon]MCX8142334.1 hypothetical protein [Candidatus Nezhaarchaeota archaeon]MDW8050693.1 hypothetical protein [Nitrososphaerota archaeon]
MSLGVEGFVSIRELEGGHAHDRFLKNAIQMRVKALKDLTIDEVKIVAMAIGGRLVDFKVNDSTAWAIAVTPLPGFHIVFCMQKYSPEFEDTIEILFSKKALELGIPAEDASEWAILYMNAMIYAIRRILKKEVERISYYL